MSALSLIVGWIVILYGAFSQVMEWSGRLAGTDDGLLWALVGLLMLRVASLERRRP